MNIIYVIITGAIVGWLAGQIMKGKGFGIFMNTVLGILGGVLGNWLLGFVGHIKILFIPEHIIKSLIGAILIILLADALKK